MKFHEFIKILQSFIFENGTQGEYLLYITNMFLDNPDEKNPLNYFDESTLQKIYRGDPKHPISKKNAKIMSSDFTGVDFIEKMSNLDDTARETLKELLEKQGVIVEGNVGEYCAKLYLRFLVELSKGNDEILFESKEKTSLEAITTSNDDAVMIKAKAFCQNHEEELELLPLAMIAEELDPKHKNIRSIYNDFSLCTKLEKEKICYLAEEEMIKFEPDWQGKCVAMFEKVYDEYKLGSRELSYSIFQYLGRSVNYSVETIDDIDPQVFDVPYKSQAVLALYKNEATNNSLSMYIDEYLYDKSGKFNPPPYD